MSWQPTPSNSDSSSAGVLESSSLTLSRSLGAASSRVPKQSEPQKEPLPYDFIWMMKLRKFNLKAIVSSTFTDTAVERNILLHRVLVELRLDARQYVGINICFVDLRWGLKDASTNEHLTWMSCADEIARCRDESGGLFFISLQSEKYGYCPLPRSVPNELFENSLAGFAATSGSSQEEIQRVNALAKKWYLLDENSMPAEYVLTSLTKDNEKEYWEIVLPEVRKVLEDTSCFADPDLLVGRSVTEYEFKFAMKDPTSDAKRCVWFRRKFSDSEITDRNYCDTQDLSSKLKKTNLLRHMEGFLGGNSMSASIVDAVDESGVVVSIPLASYMSKAKDDYRQRYENAWYHAAKMRLSVDLASLIDEYKQWQRCGGDLNVPGEVASEFIHHYNWCRLKCSTFIGREDLIGEGMDLIYRNDSLAVKNVGKFRCITGAIVGKSGSGKTALMSVLAHSVMEQEKLSGRRPVLVRYCGTSSGSGDGLSLVRSLCLEIQCYTGRQSDDVPSTYLEAVKHFHSLFTSHACIVFIDSLDQLSNQYEACSGMTFLRDITPHIGTRVIVSCLPDEKHIDTGKWLYCYGCDTRLKEANIPRVMVPLLANTSGNQPSTTDVGVVLKGLLAKESRTLTPFQFDLVVKRACEEPTALYLSLAVQVVRHWTSNQAADSCVLAGTVSGLISQLFDSLEICYGAKLTRFALSLLTHAVDGLRDTEMEDLLSLNDDVLKDVFQYHESSVPRLPSHVWIRLRDALKGLVMEGQGGSLRWYHRQLLEVARARYSGLEKVMAHEYMAVYFGNLVREERLQKSLIAYQPITLNDASVWLNTAVINQRRCVEASSHMIASGKWKEAADEICDLKNICAILKCAEVVSYQLVRNVVELHSIVKGLSYDFPLTSKVHDYMRWLQQTMSQMQSYDNPAALMSTVCTTTQPLISIARQDVNIWLQKNEECSFWRGNTLGGYSDFTQLQMSLIGHTDEVTSVSLSSDGCKIVSGSDDKTIKVWDVVTGAVLSTLEGHSGYVTCVSFSPDGSKIVSGSGDKTIKVWDSVVGAVLSTLGGHNCWVTSVSFSPDGSKIVSGSDDKTIKVWDTAVGAVLSTLQGHTSGVKSVSFSPDGSNIVSGSDDKTINVYDVETGAILSTLVGHTLGVSYVCFCSVGNKIVSGSWDKTIKVWDTVMGAVLSTLEGHTLDIRSVSFSPDGSKIVSGSRDKTIKVWDVVTGAVLSTLEGHTLDVRSVCFSPEGSKIVSASGDKTIKVWDALVKAVLATFEGHNGYVTCVSFSPDGSKIVSASRDKTIKVWDVVTGGVLSTLEDHTREVTSVSFSSDGSKIVSGSLDKTIKVWDVVTGAVLSTLEGHSGYVTCVSFSPDGSKIVSGSDENTIQIWDTVTGAVLSTLEGNFCEFTSLSFSLDGSKIVSGSNDNTIQVWDVVTGAVLSNLEGRMRHVWSVCFSPDCSKIVLGSDDKTIQVWDAVTGAVLSKLEGHRDEVKSVSFSPDGSKIVSGSRDKTIKVWDVVTGAVLSTLEGHTSGVTSVSFSPDGSKIVSGSGDKTIKVWDTAVGAVLSTLQGHTSGVKSVS